jgi:tight adherence protein B
MRTLARASTFGAAAATALTFAATAAAAERELALTEAGGARFPYRSFVLTLPEGVPLDEKRVHVRENGAEVSSVAVTPADEVEGKRFGVVLVIDASDSMRGEPIEGAMAAARAFAEQRNANQHVAVVAFNSESTVLLPFTTDAAAIERALADAPPLARGTKLYDGVDVGLSLIGKAGIGAGSVVVLSDGTDTGSRVGATDVVARAKSDRVRIFSVGLRSPAFSPEALETLAVGGRYSEASSSGDLEAVFSALGAELANEYLLTYRSLASAEEDIRVSVTVDGLSGSASDAYRAPPLPPGAGSPFHHSLPQTFWRSGAAMLVVSVASAILLAFGALVLLRPRPRTLRKRMAEFVSVAAPGDDRRQGVVRAESVLASAEKSFERTRWWGRFKQDLDVAGVGMAPTHIVAWTAVGALVVALVLYVAVGALFVPLALGIPLVARSLVRRKLERRRKLFADQLSDNLQVLSSALRAGHSLIGALSMVVEDSPEPARSEFRRVIADEQLGVALEDAFAVVVERMDSRDLEQVALVAALQRETGGNTAEVVDRVAETIRERFDLRRMVRTLTTQGRMSRWIVSLLPVGLLVLITTINPGYMEPLYNEPVGRVLLVLAGVMVVAGSLVIKRIVNIKV